MSSVSSSRRLGSPGAHSRQQLVVDCTSARCATIGTAATPVSAPYRAHSARAPVTRSALFEHEQRRPLRRRDGRLVLGLDHFGDDVHVDVTGVGHDEPSAGQCARDGAAADARPAMNADGHIGAGPRRDRVDRRIVDVGGEPSQPVGENRVPVRAHT